MDNIANEENINTEKIINLIKKNLKKSNKNKIKTGKEDIPA